MEFTPNYNLKKPGQDDYVVIGDLNENSDTIDNLLKSLNDNKANETDLNTLETTVRTHTDDNAKHSSFRTSNTLGNVVSKTVSGINFILTTGARITVKFIHGNTANNPTLNVNNLGARHIYQNGVMGATWSDGEIVEFVFDGTYWHAFPTVQKSSTTQSGIVQLNNTLTSTNVDQAATANAVRNTYEFAGRKYSKPDTGIPLSDLNANVQSSISKIEVIDAEKTQLVIGKKSVAQTLNSGLDTQITFDSLSVRGANDYCTLDNNRIYLKKGIYDILLNAHFEMNGVGDRLLVPHDSFFAVTARASGDLPSRISANLFRYEIPQDDTLMNFYVRQTSGSAIDLLTETSVSIAKVGDI